MTRHSFTLLGSGTSTGVPLPACSCAVCLSGHPRNFRNRTSGLIKLESGTSFLIDAGPDLRQQALTHGVSRVDAVFYTHAHADHILGTDDLRVFNFSSRKRIACHGTRETLHGVQAVFPYIFNPVSTYTGGLVAQLDLVEISDSSSHEFDGITAEFFPLPHGNATVTGLRMGEFGYATDCKGLSPRAAEVLRGVDTLFLDALRWETHSTHNSIQEGCEIARQLGVRQTYLIHTTHSIDYEEVSNQLPEGIALGYDGLTIEFAA